MDMHIVREGESGAAAASMAEIASNPDRIDAPLRCDFEHPQQRLGTKLRCVVHIVHDTSI